MFTGLIEEVGTVKSTTVTEGGSGMMVISAEKVTDDLNTGDSICISGACQTVVRKDKGYFAVEVMPETSRRTTLGSLRPGDRVNLERALRLSDRLGGHIVSGHVDCVGVINAIRREENAWRMSINVDTSFYRYLVVKGSVAVDGISLTVAALGGGGFEVSIIPHTFENTTLKHARAGGRVNVEFDLIAKHIEALFEGKSYRDSIERFIQQTSPFDWNIDM